MLIRRAAAFLLLGLLCALASVARAEDWKAKYPELVFAIIPAENASGVIGRFTPFTEYLSRELGVPVKLQIVQDYAAVIEGQRAGQIHLAFYSATSYARAYLTGVKTEPFAIEVNGDGTRSYRAVLYVRKDSPYQTLEDLRGKNLGLVDPNSASGNTVPRYALNKLGITPEKFFGKVVYTGSHENAIFALQQGTIDAAANWWTDENESSLKRMESKGLAKYDDFRIVFTSEPILNAPLAYLSDLPSGLKAAIRDAVLNIETRAPEVFAKIYENKMRPWEPIDHSAYEPVIGLTRFMDGLRRRS